MKQYVSKAPIIILAIFLVCIMVCGIWLSQSIVFTKAAYDTAGDALVVEEAAGQKWNQLAQLNIFNQLDRDGERIIFPTSSGSYTFTVENNANYPFNYTIMITDENLSKVPMVFRLKDSSGIYVAGGDTEWVTVDELTQIHGELDQQTQTSYSIEWKWTGDNDIVDTAIGILARQGSVYTLNFNITAEQSGPSVEATAPQTGDPANLAFWLTLLSVSLIVLIVLVIIYKKERGAHEKAV